MLHLLTANAYPVTLFLRGNTNTAFDRLLLTGRYGQRTELASRTSVQRPLMRLSAHVVINI